VTGWAIRYGQPAPPITNSKEVLADLKTGMPALTEVGDDWPRSWRTAAKGDVKAI
jgi:hypothetical protein